MSTKISEDSKILADLLHSAAIHLLRKLRREDAASGLNRARLWALSVVVFAGTVTLGDLAAAEQVRPPTMTRIVDALVEQGLVVKKKKRVGGGRRFSLARAGGKEPADAGAGTSGAGTGRADCRAWCSRSDVLGKRGGDSQEGDYGDL